MATYDLHEFADEQGNVYDFTDDTAQATANSALALAEATRDVANGIGASVSSYVWLGRNLATQFATEIGSTEPITWLKNRASSADFDGLEIGDYLPVTLNNGSSTVMNYQIAGFDTYYGTGDTTNGHMITLVPAIVYPEYVTFNETATNNGTEEETSPWLASGLYTWMNETFYGYLPSAWQSALKNIRVYNPIRYSSSGTLTDDNGGKWMDLGNIWAPSEIEVWGSWRRGTSLNTASIACMDKQLPIFQNGRTVIRSRYGWWERVAASGSSSGVCYVSGLGHSSSSSATFASVRPVPFFHIG